MQRPDLRVIEGDVMDKHKALDAALAHIEKHFGKGSIMRLGASDHLAIEAIPSGALSVDYAIGIGGFPRGRVVEVYGPESSGKTTLARACLDELEASDAIGPWVVTAQTSTPIRSRARSSSLPENAV